MYKITTPSGLTHELTESTLRRVLHAASFSMASRRMSGHRLTQDEKAIEELVFVLQSNNPNLIG